MKKTSRFKSSVLALLYLSNKRTDIQSAVRLLCYEVEKSDSVGNETVETTLEVCQGHRGHVNCV